MREPVRETSSFPLNSSLNAGRIEHSTFVFPEAVSVAVSDTRQ
jgi:hypothetical protein